MAEELSPQPDLTSGAGTPEAARPAEGEAEQLLQDAMEETVDAVGLWVDQAIKGWQKDDHNHAY